MTLDEINTKLLDAHLKIDVEGSSAKPLVDLYRRAYELTVIKNPNEGFFYLTNAYVYALDTNHSDVNIIENILRRENRL